MRERISRAVSALAVTILVILSVVFAHAQNPPLDHAPTTSHPEPARLGAHADQDTVRGRAVYDRSGCARCHSIAGAGNPRVPLDGVGSRREPGSIRAWTLGSVELADSMAPSAFRAKQEFLKIAPADLDALIDFLSRLKEER